MSDPVLIGLISTLGVLAATVIVEIIRRERQHKANSTALNKMTYEMSPNSGQSMKDSLDRIEGKVDKVDERQRQYGERLTAVETSVEYLRGR